MSDGDSNSDSFPEFSGKEDVVEEGFTTSEMIIGFGFLLIVAECCLLLLIVADCCC